MTVTYNPFMLTQIAGGYSFAGKTMTMALLAHSVDVSVSTPNDIVGLIAAIGFQEISTATVGGSPTYARPTAQTLGDAILDATNRPGIHTVSYTADWVPIPIGTNDRAVYVDAAVWYIDDGTAVAGVTRPWVLIDDGPFGNVVAPGAKITNATHHLFDYSVTGGVATPINPEPTVQAPGSLDWQSARTQHIYLVPQRVNWMPNPSFEDTGNFGWRSDGTLTRVAGALDGRFFGRTTGKKFESIPIPNQSAWRLSCYVRSVTGLKINIALVALDTGYNTVATQWARHVGDEWFLYSTWSRIDCIFQPMDDVVAVVPHFESDGAFDLDMCLLEDSYALNDYWDGASLTGMPGDFTWQGQVAQSYSFYYTNRHITAARLFGEYKEGQVTLPAMVSDWVPSGQTLNTHWDVLNANDTKHPLEDWGSRVMP